MDRPMRDELYYFSDSVVFFVEDCLFRVPREHFKESEVFRTAFSLPTGGNSAEGSSDSSPIRLEGIKKVDFQNLLKVIYPLKGPGNIKLDVNGWVSVLKLSTMWMFLDIREHAIKSLSLLLEKDPVYKIILAKDYKVQEWLFNALNDLVKRKNTITTEEAERLGLDTAVRLFQLREKNAVQTSTGRYTHDNTFSIRKMFKIELDEIEQSAFYRQEASKGPPRRTTTDWCISSDEESEMVLSKRSRVR